MKNRIRTLEELREEKRLLQLEIDVTEKLIVESLHFSKENILQGVADSFFSMIRKEPLDEQDIFSAFAQPDQDKSGWLQKIIPLLPFMIKIAGSLYEKRKTRKKIKSKSGDIQLRKVAS
ncbi:MAG: hypothetical protein IPL46_10970 [Saprospiraceae bacterium]|nr:hypothetical protein [Saprospiraceae bacterium]